ncbi:peptide MFS transporter [Capnocytophaga canimorsus]|uniref:MFS transporter n=1 Tax=Capnocytophaga canimorsus TaxID=28188 RepID=A0A250G853_9FLAO|nr:peptide MFS transporter [Capnocytophaga canimorsus]ATA92426.1 MFS transporter [Capnocytophaga canimorsus]AYW37869.1 MFS transporter [Capnocytophaga canimorsus]MDT9498720.1 oligopeptide:H+ symporter [Capnocytophaga canimorsus]
MLNPDYKLMLIAWLGVALWVGFVIFSNRKIHPKALFTLFMVELWERFSYYGMRALLILYMTANLVDGGFQFDDAKAFGIYGAYGALVYLTPILGGYFADKLIGFRRAIAFGAILMAAGQFTLFANNQTTFFIGLALLVVGNGFFKPNISSMIGRFYADGDKRRDGAFTLFYMGINMGAFLAPLTCGAIGENEGWQYGFLTAGIGMLLGFIIFFLASRTSVFQNIGLAPDEKPAKNVVSFVPNSILPYVAAAVMVGCSLLLIQHETVVDYMLGALAVIIIGYLLFQASKMELVAKQRIWVVVLLLLFTTIFWTFFELAGSALNLFTARNVDKMLFGFEMKTTYFQSFNPLYIMLFAPVFSWIWIKLSNLNKEPAAPYKFGTGLLLLGLGFLVLKFGGSYAKLGMVPAIFMALLYLLHTLGELALSPVGLSLVTKLSPKHMVAFMMGIWFLSSSIAHQGGKHIAKLTTVNEKSIVEGASFQNADIDKDIKAVLSEKTFKDKLEKSSVESILVSDAFIERLNKLNPQRQYAKSVVTIKETLEDAENYSGTKKDNIVKSATQEFLSFKGNEVNTQVATFADYESLVEKSPEMAIVNVIKGESLNKGLSVFTMLGFIAIGCGIVLFLMGPFITRWMHGVK